MWDNLLVAVNAVVPFLCYLAFGYVLRERGVVTEDFMQSLNKMLFKVMFPFMTFYNVYSADISSLPSLKLIVFSIVSILALVVLLILVVPRLVSENPKRGVIIQATFRSNFVLFGIPLTVNVFGSSASSVAAMMVAVVVTLYNITSVIVLEMFQSGEKTSKKSIVLNILKNPLIDGCLLGLAFLLLGIRLPSSLETPIAAFSDLVSPLALLVLGGTLHFNTIGKNLKYLVPSLTAKLVLIPAVMVSIAYAVGLRELELFLVLVIFGAPVAAASYSMAQNMEGDGELAGQFVATSTVVSVGTLFVWIYVMKTLGLI